MAELIISNEVLDGIDLTNDDMIVSKGGIAVNTYVENDCTLYVFEGGTASNTTLGDGGYLLVTDGGTASNVLTQGQDAVVEIYEGGELYDATINAGGWISVLPGAKAVGILENGGYVDIMDGAEVTFVPNEIFELVVSANQLATIHSATTVNDTLVTGSGQNGGMLFIYPDVVISDIEVTSNGSVENDGFLSTITVREGGYVNTRSGQMQYLTLSSGGNGVVYHGGSGMDVTVEEYGRYLLYGGKASNTTVSSGGTFTIQNAINSATEAVQSAIASSSIILNGGEMRIVSCGTADNTFIESGGSLFIYSGGTATNLVVEEGGILNFEIGPDTYVQGTSGGSAFIMANAFLSDFDITGGTVKVLTDGKTKNNTVRDGGDLSVHDGGEADDVTVDIDGRLYVWGGGRAKGVKIHNGGYFAFLVSPNTSVEGTSGTTPFKAQDGQLSDYVIESGRVDVVDGTVQDITINASGELHISSGSIAENTTVNSAGEFHVSSGGMAKNTTVNTDGEVYVSGGGVAKNTTVNNGGNLFVSSGGKLTGQMEFAPEAFVVVNDDATLDFDLTGTTAGAAPLVNDLSLILGTPGFTLTVDGTLEYGDYLLAEGAAGFDSTITVVNADGSELGAVIVGGTLTVDGTSYTLNLSESTLFVSVSDGTGTPVISSGVVIEGGEQIISSGVIYETTIVSSGGSIRISRGGIANAPTVYDGGGIDVYSGGLIRGAVISSGYLTIHSSGTADFTTIVDGGSMFISNGGYASDTICSSGSVTVFADGIADGVDVRSKGKLHISSGGTLTGQMTFENGAIVSAHSGAIIDFDLTGTTAGAPALMNDFSIVRGTPAYTLYTLTVDGMQETGSYALAENATGFAQTITVRNPAGEELGTISVGGSLATANAQYTLRIFQGVLSVSVAEISSASVVSSGLVLLDEGRIVSDGEIYEDTTIFSGGWLYVSSGGVADDVYVDFQGEMIVSSGGKATGNLYLEDQMGISFEEGSILEFDLRDTPPGAPALVNDLSRIEGTPAYTLVVNTDQGYGVYFLARGAEGFDQTISVVNKIGEGLGTLSVGNSLTLSGIDFTLVLSEGALCLSVTANSDTPITYNGLVLTNENRTVYPGEIYEWITVNNGSWLYVTSGGFVTMTTVSSGGGIQISSGGTVDNSVISGYLAVSSGGNLNDATVIAGGLIDIFSSGTANDTIVSSGGSMYVSNGGTANKTTVNANGELTVFSSGMANSTTVNDDGNVYVSSSGIANRTTVNDGGSLTVFSGGTANFTTVNYNGNMYVSSGGEANSTTVKSSGNMYVADGGEADRTVVSSGAFLRVASGGSASLVEALSGALLDFTVAPDTYIGGTYDNAAFEIKDGVAKLYSVNSGCILRVSSGGTASGTFVYDSGDLQISSGGVASRTQVSGGKVYVKSGGMVESSTVNTGDILVSNGGTTIATTVNSGWLCVSSGGSADNTTVNSGGNLYVSSGGSADNTTVNSGGSMFFSSGGTATNIVAAEGARLNLVVASDTCIQGEYNGSAFEMKDAFISGYEIQSDCGLEVSSGGMASLATVNGGGFLTVSDGGRTDNSLVSGYYAFLVVSSGGIAAHTTVDNHGRLLVSSGAVASNTIAKALFYIYDGGMAQKTVLVCGNMSATSAVVSEITISSEGSLTMYSGKLTGKITVEDGATVTLTGTVLDFDISRLAPEEGALVNNLSMFQTGTYTLTVSDTQWNGVYTLAEGAAGFDNLITVKSISGETLELMAVDETVTVNGVEYTLTLADDTLTVTVTGGDDLPVIPVYADITDPTNQVVTVTAEFGADSEIQEYSFDNETWLAYTEPVSFEENGSVHFIGRRQDGTVTEAASYEVTNIDKVPPEAPAAAADISTPTNTDVFVSAEFSEDTVYGEYSLDGENWNDYSGAVKFEENGIVYFRGTDAVGNVSDVTPFEVTNIDKIPPEAPTAAADVTTPTNQAVSVSATFSDDSAKQEYSLDGETWNDYTGAVSLAQNGTVYFRGTDAVGNVSDVTPFEVTNIDTTVPEKPTFTVDVTTPTNTAVTVTAEFSADSVRKEYSLDSQTWQDYTGAITFAENGAVSFRGIDEAGNVSELASWTVDYIDKVKPVLSLTGDNTTPLQASTLTATVDDGSRIYYRIGDSEAWTEYTGMFEVKANATYSFKATDAAGNTGTADITFANIDTAAPVITLTGNNATPLQASTLTATVDDGSRIYYRFGDSEAWTEYTGMIEVKANATYDFKATDAAGNVGTASIAFGNIDTTAPTVSNVEADVTTPTNQDVVVTASFADNVAVASSLYRIGETGEWTNYGNGVTVTQNAVVYFKAVDTAGNESSVVSCEVGNIDKTKPVITLIGDNQTPVRQTLLAALTDDGSEIYYSTDNATWTKFEGQFVVDANATYYFKATDTAGNTGTNQITFANIDKDAPAKPLVSADVTTSTNQPVTVTAEFSADALVRQYSLDGETWQDYTAPLLFETNGVVTFLCADAAGNETYNSYAVTNIDKDAPAKPVAYTDVTQATNGSVTVTAVFSEDSEKKEFSLDGQIWAAYAGAVKFTGNGTVYFRGTDAAGNVSEVTTFEVANIDTVAPEKPVATADIAELTNANVSVSAVFSTDSLKKEYSLDGKNWLSYTEAITFTENGTVSFRGFDEAGNVSEVTTFAVTNIDKSAPIAPTAAADITAATNGDVLVSAMFSADSVAKEYSLDGKTWQDYTAAVKFTENGTILFRGIDEAGNVSEVTSFAVTNIDKVAPVAPIATPSTTNPTKQSVSVTGVFSEDCATREYSNDGQTWLVYTAPITFTENGTVYFRGTDAAGNISAVTTFAVDNIVSVPLEPPVVSADITAPTNGSVTVSAAFSDVAAVKQYSVDGQTWLDYSGPLAFSENGFVVFLCVDATGECAYAAYAVTNIDKTAPEQPGAYATATAPTNRDVTVKAMFSNDTSKKEYSLDGTAWLPYADGIVFEENGMVYFRGTDAAGNVSGVTKYEVTNIDKVAPDQPVASADVTSPTNTNVVVTASFSDDSVRKDYSLDGETWTSYEEAIAFSENGSVSFRSFDEAGNVSEITSYEVANIDTTAPKKPAVSADITAPTNTDVLVSAVFSEDSVVRQYSLDGKTWTAYTEAVRFAENGTAYFRGIDEAGNVSETTVFEVANIDKIIPEAPVASANTTAKTYQNVTVTAVFSEDSVVRQYSLDGRTWAEYTKGISFSDNGIVFFRSSDAAGNVSEVVSYTVDNIKQPVNGPDDGWNDFLYDHKKGLNTDVENFLSTPMESGSYEVLLDEEASVSVAVNDVTYNNFVGKDDKTDYAKIVLDHSARLSFAVNSTDAAKFVICSMVAGTGRKAGTYTMKTLQTTTLKQEKNATVYAANTSPLLLEAGEYYISMQSTNKKNGEAFYNVSLNGDASEFFPDSGNDDWTDLKESGGNSSEYGEVGTLNASSDCVLDGWVGFGDSIDYAKFSLASAAKLSFTLNATDAAKFTVYTLSKDKKGKWTLKSLQATTLSKPKTAEEYSATTKTLVLNAGEYYFSMQSTNAAKGGSAYYDAYINDATAAFFVDHDDGANNWVYDKSTKALNSADNFITTEITAGTGEILLDEAGSGMTGWNNYVGYGDEADYGKITLSENAKLSFSIEAADASKFVIYSLTEQNGKYTLKALQTTALKKAKGASVYTATTKVLSLAASGEYYISMQSTNAKKGGAAYYNVQLNTAACVGLPENVVLDAHVSDALAMLETDSLNLTEGLSLGQNDADALADVTASTLAELDDKAAWLSSASLA